MQDAVDDSLREGKNRMSKAVPSCCLMLLLLLLLLLLLGLLVSVLRLRRLLLRRRLITTTTITTGHTTTTTTSTATVIEPTMMTTTIAHLNLFSLCGLILTCLTVLMNNTSQAAGMLGCSRCRVLLGRLIGLDLALACP